jgi:hypothetical protein
MITYRLKLVTRAEAKDQVEVVDDEQDAKIDVMREDASSVVLDYLKNSIDPDDTSFDWCDNRGEPVPGKVPGVIRRAVFMELGAYFENRDGSEWRSPTALSQNTISLLAGYFKPGLG